MVHFRFLFSQSPFLWVRAGGGGDGPRPWSWILLLQKQPKTKQTKMTPIRSFWSVQRLDFFICSDFFSSEMIFLSFLRGR